jgi:signal transduction histidine kinase
MEEHEQEIRESLSLIAAESRRCGELVNSLLTFARVPPMNTGDIDINEVIQQALRLIEHKVELANISVHLELSPELPLVHGDSAQLEQVFLALAMNAIEAIGREGNLMIRTSTAADGQVIAEIRDDGCGIPEELMPRIFDPFLTTKEAGVGLGLAISRTIVDRHGGDISINSQPGQGSTFSIRLPAAVRTAVASPALLAVH